MADGINPWTAFWAQKEAREASNAQPNPVVAQGNQALIDRENKMFPNFSALASKFAGPATEPRFGNFSAIADTFGAEHDAQGNRVNPMTMSNQEARSLGQPHLSPSQEADDYVDGADYDMWANDFTADDIVNAVAPKAPGKAKTPKKQLQKRAAVKKAVAPAKQKRYATVDPLNLFGNKNGVNPFESRGNPITNDRFNGGYVPTRKVKADTADLMSLF